MLDRLREIVGQRCQDWDGELLELVQWLRELPLGVIDIMEVAPNWDPTGRTQALAATALIETLSPRIFKVSPADTRGLTR